MASDLDRTLGSTLEGRRREFLKAKREKSLEAAFIHWAGMGREHGIRDFGEIVTISSRIPAFLLHRLQCMRILN